MTIAYLTASASRRAGGLFNAVGRLAQESARFPSVSLRTFALEDLHTQADRAAWNGVPLTTVPVLGPRSFGYAPRLLREVVSAQPDLLHQHGLWMYPSVVCHQWSRLTGKPYIISPHGMLEPWARKYHFWKKLPVWLLSERRHLNSAAVLHATSEQEAMNLRALRLKPRIAVIPIGVDVPELPASDLKPCVDRRAVFLSRVHPKKGLLNLIKAWREVQPSGWSLLIAGPDENNHLSVVKKAVQQAGLDSVVHFVGPVYGEEKLSLLDSAQLFVLPTFSENFGLVVAEALARRLPVITTRGTPWSCLETHQCGWWVDIGVAPLARALSEATKCSRVELQEMGGRGRELVSRDYSWGRIAAQMADLYRWVLGGGPQPNCLFDG